MPETKKEVKKPKLPDALRKSCPFCEGGGTYVARRPYQTLIQITKDKIAVMETKHNARVNLRTNQPDLLLKDCEKFLDNMVGQLVDSNLTIEGYAVICSRCNCIGPWHASILMAIEGWNKRSGCGS
jgi:hypothetical protein